MLRNKSSKKKRKKLTILKCKFIYIYFVDSWIKSVHNNIIYTYPVSHLCVYVCLIDVLYSSFYD